MAEPQPNDTPPRNESDAYQQTRKAFQHLALEEKALFLVEATTSTLLRGLEAFTREMTSQFEEAFTPHDTPDQATDEQEASDTAEASADKESDEDEAVAEEASEKKAAKKTTSKKKTASKKGKKTSRKKKADDDT